MTLSTTHRVEKFKDENQSTVVSRKILNDECHFILEMKVFETWGFPFIIPHHPHFLNGSIHNILLTQYSKLNSLKDKVTSYFRFKLSTFFLINSHKKWTFLSEIIAWVIFACYPLYSWMDASAVSRQGHVVIPPMEFSWIFIIFQ